MGKHTIITDFPESCLKTTMLSDVSDFEYEMLKAQQWRSERAGRNYFMLERSYIESQNILLWKGS